MASKHTAPRAVLFLCRTGLLLTAALAAGCGGPGGLARMNPWSRSRHDLLADNTRGPLERILEQNRYEAQAASLGPAAGIEEYEHAEGLYRQEKYAEAEKDFRKVARKYGEDDRSFVWRLWPFGNKKENHRRSSPVAEDALFMVGECRYAQGRYSKAQDSYEELLKEYPSTRHLESVTQRLFAMGRMWLNFPEVVRSGDVQMVNMERPRSTPPPPDEREKSLDPTRAVPILPNFHDRSRPVFDTEGHALQALKSIWLHDPTGPLADDALMLTASHYLRRGNYLEADHYYKILREQYPDSPHLQHAFVLGSHAKLVSYQGALYDGTHLDDARKLKESTLRLYPDLPERERVLEEIRKIDEAKARREWETVVYWQKKRRPVSVATACREVIRLYPHSSYAEQARELLAKLEGRSRPDMPEPDDLDDYGRAPRPLNPPLDAERVADEPPGRVRL